MFDSLNAPVDFCRGNPCGCPRNLWNLVCEPGNHKGCPYEIMYTKPKLIKLVAKCK